MLNLFNKNVKLTVIQCYVFSYDMEDEFVTC